MTTTSDFNQQLRRTALLSLGLVAALIFGIFVLVGEDWIPGTIIVAASLIGLASQGPVINRICTQASPAPQGRRDRPTHS